MNVRGYQKQEQRFSGSVLTLTDVGVLTENFPFHSEFDVKYSSKVSWLFCTHTFVCTCKSIAIYAYFEYTPKITRNRIRRREIISKRSLKIEFWIFDTRFVRCHARVSCIWRCLCGRRWNVVRRAVRAAFFLSLNGTSVAVCLVLILWTIQCIGSGYFKIDKLLPTTDRPTDRRSLL